MRPERIFREHVLQLLCQFDEGINPDDMRITSSDFDEEVMETSTPSDEEMSLAKTIWQNKEETDIAINAKTPEWPVHRQPIIDRNLIRLARHEIVSEITPPIVAIDEAIELAKIFSTEQSHLFINGVLDALFTEHKQSSNIGSD